MSTQGRAPYEGMIAETVSFPGNNDDIIGGYMARPLGSGLYPGVVVIHDIFGLAEHTRELVRKFAAHGYIAIAPNFYYRESSADLREGFADFEKIQAALRQTGGIADSQVIGDLEGSAAALRSIVICNGKIGCIGYCSGGRLSLLFACNTKSLTAAVNCYGGRVVTDELTPKQPKAVIDMIADLSCPLLGLFGEADTNPSPQHVARLEEELKKHHKKYEFKSYPPDTGHAFFADHRPSYRQESAVDGWQRIFDFFGRYLS